MRRLLLVPLVVAAALAYAWWDRDTGVGTWLALREELAEARLRNEALRGEIRDLRGQAEQLESDPAAIERAIREDLGFGRPGETVVVLPRRDEP